jgi:hypothetical protein
MLFFNAYIKNIGYILKHKWFVFIECCKLGMPFRGLIHDRSKFGLTEFKAYALYFFATMPKWDEVKHYSPTMSYKWSKDYAKEIFDVAWLHHQRYNKHHWEYWVNYKRIGDTQTFLAEPMKMPNKYMKEMLADWRGAGRAINGKDDTKEFYLKNKDKIILHPETRKWIEGQLNI